MTFTLAHDFDDRDHRPTTCPFSSMPPEGGQHRARPAHVHARPCQEKASYSLIDSARDTCSAVTAATWHVCVPSTDLSAGRACVPAADLARAGSRTPISPPGASQGASLILLARNLIAAGTPCINCGSPSPEPRYAPTMRALFDHIVPRLQNSCAASSGMRDKSASIKPVTDKLPRSILERLGQICRSGGVNAAVRDLGIGRPKHSELS